VRIIFAIGWFLAGAIAILATVLGAHGVGYLIVFPDGKHQVELATLFLAAATLVITTVAIILAVAAVVGYTALKDAAASAGKEAGEKAARELLADMVQREVAARLAAPQGPDRTEELTAALAERGNDGGPAPN
jgi:membrane protein implicated in regulation of membrane protease activity